MSMLQLELVTCQLSSDINWIVSHFSLTSGDEHLFKFMFPGTAEVWLIKMTKPDNPLINNH